MTFNEFALNIFVRTATTDPVTIGGIDETFKYALAAWEKLTKEFVKNLLDYGPWIGNEQIGKYILVLPARYSIEIIEPGKRNLPGNPEEWEILLHTNEGASIFVALFKPTGTNEDQIEVQEYAIRRATDMLFEVFGLP
jgi:hypothetical protein